MSSILSKRDENIYLLKKLTAELTDGWVDGVAWCYERVPRLTLYVSDVTGVTG